MMTGFGVFGTFFVVYVTLSSAETLSAPEDVSRGSLQKLSLANNELAFNLLRRLTSGSSDNVFFSPFSISTAFGLLFYGARGETAQELRKALGYEKADLPNELVSENLSRYLKEVLKSGNSSNGYILNAANAILVDKKLNLLEEYRRSAQQLYKADVRNVDFAKETPRILQEINTWVKEKTHGKIEKLLDQLSPATIFVLLNAVYFKGIWENQFDPQRTRDAVFYNNGIYERSVHMMRMTSYFLYDYYEDFQVLELPYKGGNVSMLILLPNQRDGLKDLEESLTPEKLAEVQSLLYWRLVDVSLPKFKLQFQKDLSTAMQALGANQIFRTGADFSGMTSNRNVKVSQVLHKAVIEVNEVGSEAAAVTGMIIPTSLPPQFRADHPFLFAIVEKGSSSNMIWFLGSVKSL